MQRRGGIRRRRQARSCHAKSLPELCKTAAEICACNAAAAFAAAAKLDRAKPSPCQSCARSQARRRRQARSCQAKSLPKLCKTAAEICACNAAAAFAAAAKLDRAKPSPCQSCARPQLKFVQRRGGIRRRRQARSCQAKSLPKLCKTAAEICACNAPKARPPSLIAPCQVLAKVAQNRS